MKFEDFDRDQTLSMRRQQEADMECVTCPKCGSQWFEEVTYYRFQANQNLIMGQAIPPKAGSIGYKFMRCVQCTKLVEPQLQYFGRGIGADEYNYLIDTLEGKHDNRTEEINHAIKIDKL